MAKPLAVILIGISGSGKTTIAQMIHDRFGWPIVSRDYIWHAMFQSPKYTRCEREAAYNAVKRALAVQLQQGRSIIVDGMSFSRVGEFEEVQSVAKGAGATVLAFYCNVPVDVAVDRVREDRIRRRHLSSRRNERMVLDMYSRFRQVPEGVVHVDTDRRLDEVRSIVLRAVSSHGGST